MHYEIYLYVLASHFIHEYNILKYYGYKLTFSTEPMLFNCDKNVGYEMFSPNELCFWDLYEAYAYVVKKSILLE